MAKQQNRIGWIPRVPPRAGKPETAKRRFRAELKGAGVDTDAVPGLAEFLDKLGAKIFRLRCLLEKRTAERDELIAQLAELKRSTSEE
jgi:hypothetical protein